MHQDAVLDVAINEVREGLDLVELIEIELTCLELAFLFMGLVISFLFAFEVAADCGVAFDVDDSLPNSGAVNSLGYCLLPIIPSRLNKK